MPINTACSAQSLIESFQKEPAQRQVLQTQAQPNH